MAVSAIPAAAIAAPAPSFSASEPLSSDTGYTTLDWDASGEVVIQQARKADFSDARTIYEGPNHALFLSGLSGGTYYFSLRDETGAQSAPLKLTVTHQSLTQALILTAIGFLVFIATVAVIFRGARDDK
ncbi:hypothetical protein [Novosphingobium pentaromativorans]|uniref:Two component regulator three Y domain-containing protein n=1 Tax=Novosphingobium pentaromativorans US6-1 TaxID=1088721 RepID=G6EE53_9SPHN|nr:hypothetical protein [Novosphingobium pentaromativorans]AIT79542.1 hypothetical protein JI59_06950 [Novosphingobium pentaromativorans US6-1]EHJ60494.1 hypothetical protein NSU_2624 [Novosphingobium pentaromativorans US6-1]